MSDTSANNKRIAKNTLYMYFRMIVMLILSLYTARIVFNTLGVNDYGTYNIVGSIIVLFSFLNNGLSNATKRYITTEIAKGTDDSRRKVFNTAIVAHICISFIVLVIAETIGLWIVNQVLNIPEDRLFAANVVYQLSVLSTILGIMQSPFGSAILAYEKMNIYAYFTIMDVVMKLMLIFLIQAIEGDKLIIYAFLIFFVSTLNIVVYRLYCYRKFSMCKWMMVKDRLLLKKMFAYTSWSLFGQGAVVASNQGVSFLINIYFNVAVNAAMGVSNAITKVVNNFVLNFQYAFNPQITKYYVTHDTEELNKLVWRSSRYSSYLVLIFLLPICFEAKDFLHLWLGNYPPYSVEFCILTMLSVYFEAITAPLWMVLCSDSDIKTYQLTVSSIFMLNVVFSWILLIFGFAPYYVIAVRIVVDIILIMARLLFVEKKVETFSKMKWIKEVFGVSFAIALVPGALTYLVSQMPFSHEILQLFIVGGVAFVSTSVFVFLFGLTQGERNFVLSKIKNYAKIHFKKS